MTIRIGTSERAGTFNSQGLALKKVFERHRSLKPIDVLESNSASIENASRLHVGEIGRHRGVRERERPADRQIDRQALRRPAQEDGRREPTLRERDSGGISEVEPLNDETGGGPLGPIR